MATKTVISSNQITANSLIHCCISRGNSNYSLSYASTSTVKKCVKFQYARVNFLSAKWDPI